MALLLKRLTNGTFVSREVSDQVLEVLRACDSRDRIRKPLRRDVTVAHKTGGSHGIKNDVGIVYFGLGPVILCGLTLDLQGSGRGADLIAEIARAVAQNVQPDVLVP
jgi:beta-lactamase class A